MSRTTFVEVLVGGLIVLVLLMQVEIHIADNKIKHLEKACIPTYTGGGVWQCRQPGMVK